jgi:hypothetical protein
VWLFGARVAETILASDPSRSHQQAGHMDASDPIRPCKKLLWHGGRPHMGPGSRGACHRAALRADPLVRLNGTTRMGAFADSVSKSHDTISSARHCERKRSNPWARRISKLDCFVAFAPRNDATLRMCIRILAARCARVLQKSFRLSENRGRRECRALAAPAASRAK